MSKTSRIEKEVLRYTRYLRDTRGMLESSIEHHQKELTDFLQYAFPSGNVNIKKLQVSVIRSYIESIPPMKSNSKRRASCAAINGYLRFLQMTGIKAEHLTAGVPVFPYIRRSIIPKILTPKEINRFLASIDRNSISGKRNYAVILCLSDLGMRIGDVSRLLLDDIDWKNGTIKVHNRKRHNPFLLPLPERVGDALADYILNARPKSHYRHIFLDYSQDKPSTFAALKAVIQRLWLKSEFANRYSGTHIFRRSIATAMKCKGMSLKMIADILGHTSVETTALYAQVDIPALRKVAQPWPLTKKQ